MKSGKVKWYSDSLMRRVGKPLHHFNVPIFAIYIGDGAPQVVAEDRRFVITRDSRGFTKTMAKKLAGLDPMRLSFLVGVSRAGADEFCDKINRHHQTTLWNTINFRGAMPCSG